ncbi:MAG: triose-phosphate isomerase [Betaproteobacteria bacterium]|nr:triose-phosphate isomerase [Betaproteobacteria bacterium]
MKSGGGRLVAGNWKMHGSLATNRQLLKALVSGLAPLHGAEFAVCAPFPYLAQVATELAGSGIGWGAQTLSEHDAGAFTGEVSGEMLKDFGCTYAIVGHSERRQLNGEGDVLVGSKFVAARRNGLVPILCVGETLEERDRGETEVVVARQLDAVLKLAGVGAFRGAVLAYEPVWAIGTGRTATPAQAQGVHAFIRDRLSRSDAAVAATLTLLYGGSVKPGNAAELFAQPDIDGGLIGGASLVAGDFVAICEAASRG